jgi:hypothetical protein
MNSGKGFNNSAFINKLEPKRLIIISCLIWAILLLTSPLKVNIALNYEAFLLFFLCVTAFIIGTYLIKNKEKRNIEPTFSDGLGKLFSFVLIVSIIGVSLKYFDRIVIRGLNLGADIFSNRESMEGGSGNVVGILSSVLAPFSFFPLFLFWKYKLQISKFTKILVFSVFILQVFDSVLLGSRSSLFVIFIFLIFYLLYFKKLTFTPRKVVLFTGFVFGFIFFMNYIFVERTKVFAGDQTYELALNQSNFNYAITAKPEFKTYFKEQNSTFQNILFTYISTTQYFTHGMFEFSYLYDNFEADYAVGSYTFSVYYRMFNKLIGRDVDLNKIQNLAPRTGVYTTLLGPLYLDFGLFIILFMVLFGMFTKKIYYKAQNGNDVDILIYFYLAIVLIFSPVFNFINGAGGIFLFTSFVLLQIITKRYYKYAN